MKRFYSLILAAALMLTACTQQPSPGPSSTPAEPLPESVVTEPSSSTEEEPINLMVADAALYRGTILSIEETPEGKLMLLEQAAGTDFGSPQHKFLFTKDTRLSFEAEKLAVGAYIEVYYGVALGQASDPNEISEAIAINYLHQAEMVNFNGSLMRIEKKPDGSGSIIMKELGTDQEVVFHFDEGTQFYLSMDELVAGDVLNIFHRGVFTMSIPPQGSALEVQEYVEAQAK